MHRELELLYQMQTGAVVASEQACIDQSRKVCGSINHFAEEGLTKGNQIIQLKQFYKELTDEDISFEVPCSRNTDICERRRLAEGKNHLHLIDVVDPHEQFNTWALNFDP